MLAGIDWRTIDTVLEPSAGKGNLVRHNDDGLPYVAIKEGMLMVGLIVPFMLGAEEARLLKLYAMQARVDEISDGVSS